MSKLKFKELNQCFSCQIKVENWETNLVFWNGKLICKQNCSEIVFKMNEIDKEILYLSSLLRWWRWNKYDDNLLEQIFHSNNKIQSLRKK